MPTRGTGRRRWRTSRDEAGHILAITAASLPVILVFAAFSADTGGWYARASQLQRGADAAALAGVVWMPDFPKARTVALEQATQNGFTTAGPITVDVKPVPGNARRLTVTITDADAPVFFSRAFRGGQSITRSATAEYVTGVPMGSPKNTFGTGDLLTGADREGFWAAVSGYCAGHESGDLRLPRWESYTQIDDPAPRCASTFTPNPDYDPGGYLYAVDLPVPAASLKIDVYDAGYSHPPLSPADVTLTTEVQTLTTVFQFYAADSTPLDTGDNPLVGTVTVGPAQAAVYRTQWQTLHTFSPAPAGTYYVRVKTDAQSAESRASNGFALRAYTGGSFTVCTTIPGQPGYSAACPHVHGLRDMSIFANLPGAAGAPAVFYLAEVEPVHAGKIMRVTLFDAGEGAQSIEILDPTGAPVTFDWSTPCNPPTPPTGGCSGTGASSLAVGGTGTQPYPGLVSTSKYNDRKLVLLVQLPASFAAYGSNYWWRVRYTVGTTPNDRTTWAVSVIGDPVHLVGT